jgi:hypothetical protein
LAARLALSLALLAAQRAILRDAVGLGLAPVGELSARATAILVGRHVVGRSDGPGLAQQPRPQALPQVVALAARRGQGIGCRHVAVGLEVADAALDAGRFGGQPVALGVKLAALLLEAVEALDGLLDGGQVRHREARQIVGRGHRHDEAPHAVVEVGLAAFEGALQLLAPFDARRQVGKPSSWRRNGAGSATWPSASRRRARSSSSVAMPARASRRSSRWSRVGGARCKAAGAGDSGIGRAAGEQAGVVAKAEATGEFVELCPYALKFDLPLGQVLGGLDDGRALVRQPVDGVGLREQRVIDAEGFKLRFRFGDLLVEALNVQSRACGGFRGRRGSGPENLPGPSGSGPRCARSASRSSMRRRRGIACFSRASREDSSRSLRCSCLSSFNASARLVATRSGLADGLGLQAFLAHPLAGLGVALAGLPEGARGHLAPAGNSCSASAAKLARSAISDDRPGAAASRVSPTLPPPSMSRLAPARKPLAVEPEGIEEQRPVDVAEEGRQGVLGQRRLVGVEQRVLVALAAPEVKAPAVLAEDRRAKTHVG